MTCSLARAWTKAPVEAQLNLRVAEIPKRFAACHDGCMGHPTSLLFVAAMLLGCSGAQQHHDGEPDRVHADASVAGGSAAIAAAMRGSHRSPSAADRDQYRHPVETLAFFGFTPTMTVLDVGPGTGYYAELLAPVLAKDGLYLATNGEPPSTAAAPSGHHWTPYEGARFDALLRAAPELYGKVQVIRVDYEAPHLDLDGKIDMVLLMREVHMMKNWGTLDTWLREKIEAAGFALAGKSEINANPRDTKDYPNGVWSLPPSFQAGPDYNTADARDRAKSAPIGESDRMTLKFVRVPQGAAQPAVDRIVRSVKGNRPDWAH
jgi:predicted methyltransferase